MTFSQKLLAWFDKHGRHDLPWQKKINPYRVWVSEIMLQQTQVSTVIDYFQRFMKRFPTLSKLAEASLDEVFQYWAGLGYYARAKHLHQTAQRILTEYKGKFPTDFETVVSLPGIGRSTAGAILAISTDQRFPILDGNVKRVLSRYFAIEGLSSDPKILQTLWDKSDALTPQKRVADYTQAIMDLGATLCTRTKPRCIECPVAKHCEAHQLNQVHLYPTTQSKTKIPTKETAVLLLVSLKKQAILLEKRPLKGIWGGLWSLPECSEKTIKTWCAKTLNLHLKKTTTWDSFKHTFSHFHLNITPVLSVVESTVLKTVEVNYQWHKLSTIQTLGLPAPIYRLLQQLQKGALVA